MALGRVNVGGGAAPVVTLYGAPGATVSWTGTAAGSAVLATDAMSPLATVTLERGTYTFTDSLSGYTLTVAVTGDTAVRLHPAGALYWYGYKTPLSGGMTANKNLVAAGGTAAGITENANSVRYAVSGDSAQHLGSYTNANALDLSGYSQLKVISTEVTDDYVAFAAAAGAEGAAAASANITAAGTAALALSDAARALTAGFAGFTFNQWHNRAYALTVTAIWLE